MGFWIHVTKPEGTVLLPDGEKPSVAQSITFHPGWNLVGYPSTTNRLRSVALNNLTFGIHVDSIWTYNSGTQEWEEIGESNYFTVGKGYWIHAKNDCVWEVPL
jgi:hypothetical protein